MVISQCMLDLPQAYFKPYISFADSFSSRYPRINKITSTISEEVKKQIIFLTFLC